MKPIAFFFTQWIDYGRLIKDQSEVTSPSAFQPKRKR